MGGPWQKICCVGKDSKFAKCVDPPNGTVTLRRDLYHMTLRNSFILLLAAIMTLAAISANASEESLFDSSTARKLNPQEISLFGPQSGKFRYDNRMIHAAEIAANRAHAHSTARCWHYVKDALFAANAVDSRPKTEYAKEAGQELQQSYGYLKLAISDPWMAPLGSVLVYGGHGAGHVEIRSAAGFVSDFNSPKPSPRPLLGIYVKP